MPPVLRAVASGRLRGELAELAAAPVKRRRQAAEQSEFADFGTERDVVENGLVGEKGILLWHVSARAVGLMMHHAIDQDTPGVWLFGA